ncbi:MAG TPA: right-handed parallel beta-helix repeat-containing protein [Verrucomicrobiae bacterium]|nr:right-handed parallel beta-helix repeat-containing protein [Verrucomicrobiae bacterium]
MAAAGLLHARPHEWKGILCWRALLQSQVVDGAIIDGRNASDRNVGFYIDGNYNVVDGFEIRNCPNGGITIWSSGNQILNNHIHHNGNPASSSSNGRDGVYSDSGTSANVYEGNYIDHNGRSGSNLDHGLYLCGDNEFVINNVLLANAASGLQIAGYSTVNNMKVYNNVMAWNGTDGILPWMALSGVDIKNNIIYQNGHWGIGCYAATGSGLVVDHNLVYGNAYGSYDFAGGGSTVSRTLGTTISADPRLVNGTSSGFNPHLASGSPAIQAGLNLHSVFPEDMAGTARPASGPWDLGVYGSAYRRVHTSW